MEENTNNKASSAIKSSLKSMFGKGGAIFNLSPQIRVIMLIWRYRVFVLVGIACVYYVTVIAIFAPIILVFGVVDQNNTYASNIVDLGQQKNPSDIIGVKGKMTSGEAIKDKNGNTLCYEPIFKPDNQAIYQAIKYIRCAEFEARNHDNTDGDADSCGGGQQRVSEYYSNKEFNRILAESLSVGEYNTIYNQTVQNMIINNKNRPRLIKRVFTSGYGARAPIFTNAGLSPPFHDGIDFGFAIGDPVFATFTGEIEEVSRPNTKGLKYVAVKTNLDKQDKYLLFLHLNQVLVTEKQKVTQGELIGYAGSTGMSTAPHLHYSIYKGKSWWWNMFNTHNPEFEFTEGLELIKTPFNAVCKMLLNANKRSGTLEIIMIARLKKEYPELFTMDKVIDKEKFINKLCATQRPIEWLQGTETCRNNKGGWLDRARKVF
jgi:murein DD-endopeptidase MepM/ murein hydrolase activator NlpD